MTNVGIELKNEDAVYDFELFFLNNIYDSLQEISDDLACLIDGYNEFEQDIYGDFISVDIESGVFRLKNICELNYDFKSVLEILKNHCEDLNVLSMKIIKKGSVENE